MMTIFNTPRFDDMELQLRARILNFFLWAAIGVNLLVYLVILADPARALRWVIIGSSTILFSITALFLLKRRHLNLAAWIITIEIWCLSVWINLTGGGLYAYGFPMFIVVIISSGIVLGRRAALIMGGLSIALQGLMVYLTHGGHLAAASPSFTPLSRMMANINYIIFFTMMTVLFTWQNRRSLRKARQENMERKKAEQLLTAEIAFSNKLLGGLPGILYLFRIEGDTPEQMRLVRWNGSVSSVLGYGDSSLAGMTVADFFENAHDPSVLRMLRDLAAGTIVDFEMRIRHADGHTIPFLLRAEGFRDGADVYLLGIGLDITERRRLEEKERAMLRQKDALLRELYHRTKNNMQVISGMLSLESARGPAELRSVFDQVNLKIRSMALVHQKLYESGDLASIDIVDYTRDLAQLILGTYDGASGGVNAAVTGETVLVSIDAAVPLGLVLNELITNSVKHAFSDGASGSIGIDIGSAEGTLTITYRDSGPGLPAGLDMDRTASLGMQILHEIVRRQLQGSLTMLEGPGFACRLTVKADLYMNRL